MYSLALASKKAACSAPRHGRMEKRLLGTYKKDFRPFEVQRGCLRSSESRLGCCGLESNFFGCLLSLIVNNLRLCLIFTWLISSFAVHIFHPPSSCAGGCHDNLHENRKIQTWESVFFQSKLFKRILFELHIALSIAPAQAVNTEP